ncbi:MAG: prephenate dehydratase [Candidatus Bathyarchaeia archaeon]
MDLEGLRREIDELDKRIVELLARRASIARAIGEVKREAKLCITDLGREWEVLSNVRAESLKLGLNPDVVVDIYRRIIDLCRSVQSSVKVAFLGPRGSFTEEAARRFFPLEDYIEFMGYPSIRDLFRAVEEGEADYGVAPIENSIEGSVNETLDLLFETKLKICGELEHRIRLNLIARPGLRIEDIKVLISHPQAINQCRSFIARALKGVEIREAASTSQAVKIALESEYTAAIGSELAAKLYSGEVLAKGIEDYRDNYTRFFLLGWEDTPRTKGCKTSIVFSTPHRPGALYRALSVFAGRGINLTKIESRPIKGRPWEYLFYVDFEGHREDEVCRQAVEDLKEKTLFVKILGSYRRIA